MTHEQMTLYGGRTLGLMLLEDIAIMQLWYIIKFIRAIL